MKNFLYRHALVLFLVVMFVRVVLGMLTVKGAQWIDPTLTIQEDLGWLVMLIYAACAFLAVKWVKIDKEIGLIMPANAKDWYVWLPAIMIPLTIAYLVGFNSTWGHVPFLLIAAVGVAVNEEILFRGILLRALLPFGKPVAIIVPSLLFGAAHLSNVFVGGDVTYALFQFGWTTLFGMALTAMVLANRSLLPAIAFHFILDGIEYAATGEYGVHSIEFPLEWLIIMLIFSVLFFIYSLYLLKKSETNSSKLGTNVTPIKAS